MSDPLSPAPHVALIIVNHDGAADTVRCLASVRALQSSDQLSVTVVDNGSTDDSVSLITAALSEIPDSTLIPMSENKGYAAGCNAGIRGTAERVQQSNSPSVQKSNSPTVHQSNSPSVLQSKSPSVLSQQPNLSPQSSVLSQQPNLSPQSSVLSPQNSVQQSDSPSVQQSFSPSVQQSISRQPDFIWLLNNDTVLHPDALETLLNSAKADPHVKIWGSTICDIDPPHALQCAGGFNYLPALSIPIPLKTDPERYKGQSCVRAENLDYISGVSMFVRADVFEKGLMDESYFLYYEELEITRMAGGKKHIAWCPQSIIYHRGGGSTGGADPNRGRGSYTAHYYGNRSALRYTWKYHKMYFPLVSMFRFVMKSVLFILYGEWRGFRPMIKAYRDFFA